MNNLLTAACFVLCFCFIFLMACTKDSGISSVTVDTTSVTLKPVSATPTTRQTALADYQSNYLSAGLTSLGWTGNSSSCDAGTTPSATKAKILQRINYFRRLVGLSDNITLNETYNSKCQQAALMMKSNNKLDHYPTTTWSCYSEEGKEAAAHSNLALGTGGPDAIDLYMQDAGVTSLGHRRWILYPPLSVVGTGDTDYSNALWVIGSYDPSTLTSYTAYPPTGYVPATLVYSQWSLGVSGADFSQATVKLTTPSGQVLPITTTIPDNGYGDNTISWQPTSFDARNLTSDTTLNVTITNVLVSNESKSYQYSVNIFVP